MTRRQLLREYIRRVLSEDEGGGDVYGDLMSSDAAGGYGMHFGNGNDLYNVFVKPFADVVGVAGGKAKELSQKGQTVLRVAFEAIVTTLVPVLKDSYQDIFANEKEKIDQIKSEYSDVYNATWDAFTNNDILVGAFMFRPDLFITAALARKAPQATAKLLSILSGGTLDNVLAKFKVSPGGVEKKQHDSHPMPVESVVREDDGEQSQETAIEKLASNKKVHAALANSPKVQQMSRVGEQLVHGTLNNVYKHASSVLGAKNLADLQNKTGKKLPGLDKLAQVPEQERGPAEQQLLATTKKTMKLFYTKNLTAQVEAAVKAGVPKDHPFVKAYQTAISKINGL